MRAFPSADAYTRAVQRPDVVFRTPALRAAEFATHPPFGLPTPASGSTAVVFRARVEGADEALRFFVREDASSQVRYTALERHFDRYTLNDCAQVSWIEDGIEVGGHLWPVVRMDWVEGRTLDAYVNHLAREGRQGALHELSGRWRDCVARLQKADFAHGDLQHGNVLVDRSSALRLVDFDGSWVSSFPPGTPPPSESGHPNYQRPDRVWGRWMDTFPGLVVYTGLLALAERPNLVKDLDCGENILFTRADLVPPCDTPVWRQLAGLHGAEARHAVDRLRRCCARTWSARGPLEELLEREQMTPRTGPDFTTTTTGAKQWFELTDPGHTASGSSLPPPPDAEPAVEEPPTFVPSAPDGSWFGQGGTTAAGSARTGAGGGTGTGATGTPRTGTGTTGTPWTGTANTGTSATGTSSGTSGGPDSGRVMVGLMVAVGLGLLAGIVTASVTDQSVQGWTVGLVTAFVAFMISLLIANRPPR